MNTGKIMFDCLLSSPWQHLCLRACYTCQAEISASMSWVLLVLGLTLLRVDPAHGTPLGAVVHVVPIESHGGERVSTLCLALKCSGVLRCVLL